MPFAGTRKYARKATGRGSAARGPSVRQAPAAQAGFSGLRRTLEAFYRQYDFRGRLTHDPIQFPRRYRRKGDIEAAGFIASCFAYGRVDLFKPVVERVLSAMGPSPHGFLTDFKVQRRGLFSGIAYRFNRTDDVVALIYVMGEILRRHGSLEGLFKSFYSPTDPHTGAALAGMVEAFLAVDTSAVYGSPVKPRGLMQFFPSPRSGSACKRANLFLRWMIRRRDIDLGIWRGIPGGKLVVPLDTHILRVSRCLGFTRRKSGDWKAALEITSALRRLDPEDPLKYDFALCHAGIAGLCGGDVCAEGRRREGSLCFFKAPEDGGC
jgi:uncharacterized protein (TIGR02757 family)